MKTMIAAFAAIVALALAADFALDHTGFSSPERQSGEAVRLD